MPKNNIKPGSTEIEEGVVLSQKETAFVKAYVANGFIGSQAALVAYDIDTDKPGYYNTAAVMAKENLRKPHIIAAINKWAGFGEISDDDVDRETAWMLIQREDGSMKKAGIDIYNRIKGRYEQDNKQKAQVINFLEDRNYEPSNNDQATV